MLIQITFNTNECGRNRETKRLRVLLKLQVIIIYYILELNGLRWRNCPDKYHYKSHYNLRSSALVLFGVTCGGNISVQKVWVGLIEFQITFWGLEKKSTGVSDLVCSLKCSRSYSEASETVITLLASGVGQLWPKIDQKFCSATWRTIWFSSRIKFSCQYLGLKCGGML